jgi:hypothetical protein
MTSVIHRDGDVYLVDPSWRLDYLCRKLEGTWKYRSLRGWQPIPSVFSRLFEELEIKRAPTKPARFTRVKR